MHWNIRLIRWSWARGVLQNGCRSWPTRWNPCWGRSRRWRGRHSGGSSETSCCHRGRWRGSWTETPDCSIRATRSSACVLCRRARWRCSAVRGPTSAGFRHTSRHWGRAGHPRRWAVRWHSCGTCQGRQMNTARGGRRWRGLLQAMSRCHRNSDMCPCVSGSATASWRSATLRDAVPYRAWWWWAWRRWRRAHRRPLWPMRLSAPRLSRCRRGQSARNYARYRRQGWGVARHRRRSRVRGWRSRHRRRPGHPKSAM